MTETRHPPTPSPAERARTIASRNSSGALMPVASGPRVVPELHHVHPSGSVSILLREEHPLLGEDEVAVMLELADPAPVELREPVRGLLWITGWLRPLSEASARAKALRIAETRPDPRLLGLGHGARMCWLTAASMVLADAEGTHSLQPHVFSAASPDPFLAYEAEWLRHLETRHPDVVGQLTRHVPEELRDGRIRPLGLDRFGLRLRVETATGDHDVRLAFSRPVRNPPQLAAELRRLVGCPFLAGLR
ncbi:MAG TPA: DUF2470 domain-containing protein [Amycolatopsis sp.]|uniref:DUF2470 domain-containing protein n=1 Tax=Amycolatopsis sp. TaxID=37632 RepID=UPI002B49E909|nr:DUF2470 domain-containing protein [Amycolatopsis sp.]HKS48101.1 DUF2470 domain-containing protein [Amycolatopsis sp.]